jgi:hypothetical protein
MSDTYKFLRAYKKLIQEHEASKTLQDHLRVILKLCGGRNWVISSSFFTERGELKSLHEIKQIAHDLLAGIVKMNSNNSRSSFMLLGNLEEYERGEKSQIPPLSSQNIAVTPEERVRLLASTDDGVHFHSFFTRELFLRTVDAKE